MIRHFLRIIQAVWICREYVQCETCTQVKLSFMIVVYSTRKSITTCTCLLHIVYSYDVSRQQNPLDSLALGFRHQLIIKTLYYRPNHCIIVRTLYYRSKYCIIAQNTVLSLKILYYHSRHCIIAQITVITRHTVLLLRKYPRNIEEEDRGYVCNIFTDTTPE